MLKDINRIEGYLRFHYETGVNCKHHQGRLDYAPVTLDTKYCQGNTLKFLFWNKISKTHERQFYSIQKVQNLWKTRNTRRF